MLQILLLILKIAGIILLSLLGLVLLVLAAVLFVPVRYSADVRYYDNSPEVKVKVSWLLRLVRGSVIYNNADKLKIAVKVLFFKVYPNEKASDEHNEAQNGKTKKAKEKSVFDEDGLEENQTLEENCNQNNNENVAEADKAKEVDKVNEAETDSDIVQSDSDELEDTQQSENASKKNIFAVIKAKIELVKQKIKEMLEKLKEIYSKIITTKNTIKEKITFVYEQINDPDNKEFIKFLWEQLKILLKKIKPKKGRLYVHFGMEDPQTTGNIAMYAAVLYGIMGIDVKILPDFSQQVIEGELYLKGGIRIFDICVIALRIYMDKNFKRIVLKKPVETKKKRAKSKRR